VAASGVRPNILWICTEHQRFDTVRALGHPHIYTPNLDRLVREGTSFTHAFAQNPVCTPSRCSFLTGRYPRATRCRQNGQSIPDSENLISYVLSETGYDCGLAGKLHVRPAASGSERRGRDGFRMFAWSHGSTARHGGEWIRWLAEQGRSFEEVYHRSPIFLSREVQDGRLHQTTWCFDRALEFLTLQRAQPWLLCVNPFAAHAPFDYLPDFLEHYDPATLPLPRYREGELENKPRPQRACFAHRHGGYEKTTPYQRREMVAAYYATIEHIDQQLGRLLDALDATGQSDRTLVLFMADHGDLLGDHGLFTKGPFLYDVSLRVPLIFRWPGRIAAGRRSDALVELVDIVPTLCDLFHMPYPPGVQGRSLVPFLCERECPEEHRSGIYAEYYHSNPAHGFPDAYPVYATTWRQRDYKVVVYHGTDDVGELYDLKRDPNEHENRWNDPGYRDIREEMVRRCFDAQVFTMDPLPERESSF